MIKSLLSRIPSAGVTAILVMVACLYVSFGGIESISVLIQILTASFVVVILIWTVWLRIRFSRQSEDKPWEEFFLDCRLGLSLTTATYLLVALFGSVFHPIIYAVVAFSATFLLHKSAWIIISIIAVIEFLAPEMIVGVQEDAFIRVGLVLGAGVVHVIFMRSFVFEEKQKMHQRFQEKMKQALEDMHDYGIVSTDLEEEQNISNSPQLFLENITYLLKLVKMSQQLETCVLFSVDDKQEKIKIKSLITDSSSFSKNKEFSLIGIPRTIVRTKAMIVLSETRSNQIIYYTTQDDSGAFFGIPLVKEGSDDVWGILCANRKEPFAQDEVEILSETASQLMRNINAETMVVHVKKAHSTIEKFYQASDMLGYALTVEQVSEAAFDATLQIVNADVIVLALYNNEEKKHSVINTRLSKQSKKIVKSHALDRFEFADNKGLASMALRTGHSLPVSGTLRESSTPIFSEDVEFKHVGSVLVCPLVYAERSIGTFTLIASKENCFSKNILDMLGIIVNQIAVSLKNAQLYTQMELMAKRDVLTGLLNRRAFEDKLDTLLKESANQNNSAAVILIDIDHFKDINDNYGHLIGDDVLREMSTILKTHVDNRIILARYGGEEFCIVVHDCEKNDALIIAETIRKSVKNNQFSSCKLSVTLSLGIAFFPKHGTTQDELVGNADKALYQAKESGRDQVVLFNE